MKSVGGLTFDWGLLAAALAEPSRRVAGLPARRQARLFAWVSLLFAFLSSVGWVANILLGTMLPGELLLGFAAWLWGCYALSRTRLYRVGIFLALFAWTIGSFLYALWGQNPIFALLCSLPGAFAFASGLLSDKKLLAYFIFTLLVCALLPLFAPVLRTSAYISFWGALVSVAALLFLNQNYRSQLEKDRLESLAQAREESQLLQHFLEKQVQELHRAQSNLQKTQALLVSMVEHMPAGMIVSENNQTRIVNPAAVKILAGQDATMETALAVLRQTPWDFLHPDGSKYTPDELPLRRALMTGEMIYNEEALARHPNGETRWVLSNAFVIFNSLGEKLGAAVVFQDITERKLAETRIRENENKYRQLFDAETDAIFLVDRQSSLILDANLAAITLYGYSREELVGQPFESLEAVQDIEPMVSLWGGLEIGYHHDKKGNVFPVELTGRVFEMDGQEMRLAAVRDITEREQAEAQIRQLNNELEQRVIERTSQLEQANRELEAFSYSVSHDLRAPLRAINGYTRMVLDDAGGVLSERSRMLLVRAGENATQMGILIDDLLAFAKLGRYEVHKQKVRPAPLVRRLAEELLDTVPDRKIEIDVSDMPHLFVDWNVFKQVYQNLLSNAVKFTRHCDEARIEVGTLVRDGNLVYFVRDNGAGFNMEYASKLFGVFQRLHRQDEFEGMGVGLAIVHRIITKHGGRVWAEGEPNRGAAFYFAFDDD